MPPLLQPLPGIDNQRVGIKAADSIVQAMYPVEDVCFDPSHPSLTHARMACNCHHVTLRLSYDLIGVRLLLGLLAYALTLRVRCLAQRL
jgi:hypothetical protein